MQFFKILLLQPTGIALTFSYPSSKMIVGHEHVGEQEIL